MSKDELRGKLAEMYKAGKDQVSVFGFRTHYGGGKSTGFALLYDSVEALKKFEPHYRLVRIGQATKIEKASRQQRTLNPRNYCRKAAGTHADLCMQASKERIGQRPCGALRRRRGRRNRRTRSKRPWSAGMIRRVLVGERFCGSCFLSVLAAMAFAAQGRTLVPWAPVNPRRAKRDGTPLQDTLELCVQSISYGPPTMTSCLTHDMLLKMPRP